MKQVEIVVLGCGFTGSRVAERFLLRGMRVILTTRNPEKLASLRERGAEVVEWDAAAPEPLPIPNGAVVLHSIPSVLVDGQYTDPTPRLLQALRGIPSRFVYLSTTGVYGRARDVDDRTPVQPASPREHVRVEAEEMVASGPWSTLILRPAAIYGRGRGIHVSMADGKYGFTGDGANFVSRIHVEDLAAHCEAALQSDLTGAYPVADEHPCTAREIAQFCAELLGVPMPRSVSVESVHDTRRADRRVDGRAIRNLLGIALRYSSYRTGIPAALSQE